MALKKSELYSSLWSSCDELRGGMDASQYKDYVLVLLFVKYISDKYAGKPYSPIIIPKGASFKDMVNLKGTSDIGDQINKKILGPLSKKNKLSDMPDFNDATKLGTGKVMVDRLTNLIAIFEDPRLNFSKNRAEGDDILGDANEYLMRKFATESGKSKGQFYTPAEVSRIMAMIVGIHNAETTSNTTVYDPTCGSGSLLLKVGDQARTEVTLYGQEKDAATSGLARMNMILHNNPTALVMQGNTLTNPHFSEKGQLKTFDFVVANPPFSDKRWSTGLNPQEDPYERFKYFGIPPGKQGDYAYLLHIVRSLKSSGKGACILPHGVLFRGHAEAEIRRNLIRKGYIKGIIGLPPNLFYGTGIPACIVVVDKEGAVSRKGIFMVDASKGFIKDGNKNRLRERDIHRIVETFTAQSEKDPKYARMVSFKEIEKNEYNLNIPRYIDSQEPEDTQDIDGHLRGGIPQADVDALQPYWDVCPNLRKVLFKKFRKGYLRLAVEKSDIKQTIYDHPEFKEFISLMEKLYRRWRKRTVVSLKDLEPDCRPKEIIADLSNGLLKHYAKKPLIDNYDVYQDLMDYWISTMQDDCYMIAADGWKAETERVIVEDKKGEEKDKGWACDLVPKSFITNRFYSKELKLLNELEHKKDNLESEKKELEEEHGGDGGALSDVGKITDAKIARYEAIIAIWDAEDPGTYGQYTTALSEQREHEEHLTELESKPIIQRHANARGKITQKKINERLKKSTDQNEISLLQSYKDTTAAIKDAKKAAKELLTEASDHIDQRLRTEPKNEDLAEFRIINTYIDLNSEIKAVKKDIKDADADLDAKAYKHYPELTEDAIKMLVVEDKWLASLEAAIHGEIDRISQALTRRVKELAERYETPLPQAVGKVAELEKKVDGHLEKMGFSWK